MGPDCSLTRSVHVRGVPSGGSDQLVGAEQSHLPESVRTRMKGMSRVRIDKWLWAARFFKTRTLATKACDLGRVEAAGQSAKPSREVKAGESLHIKTEAGDYRVEVLELSETRGPAAVAQLLLPGDGGEPRCTFAGGGGSQGDEPVRGRARRASFEARPAAHHSISGSSVGLPLIPNSCCQTTGKKRYFIDNQQKG